MPSISRRPRLSCRAVLRGVGEGDRPQLLEAPGLRQTPAPSVCSLLFVLTRGMGGSAPLDPECRGRQRHTLGARVTAALSQTPVSRAGERAGLQAGSVQAVSGSALFCTVTVQSAAAGNGSWAQGGKSLRVTTTRQACPPPGFWTCPSCRGGIPRGQLPGQEHRPGSVHLEVEQSRPACPVSAESSRGAWRGSQGQAWGWEAFGKAR